MSFNPPYLVIDGTMARQQLTEASEADAIARANGFTCAEHFVKAYAGKRIWIDHNMKVTTAVDIKGLNPGTKEDKELRMKYLGVLSLLAQSHVYVKGMKFEDSEDIAESIDTALDDAAAFLGTIKIKRVLQSREIEVKS